MANEARHRSLRNIGAEMASIGADLERLGAALCEDGEVSSRHMRHLQAIDLLAQRQRGLAAILLSNDMAEAIRACPLAELADRIAA